MVPAERADQMLDTAIREAVTCDGPKDATNGAGLHLFGFESVKLFTNKGAVLERPDTPVRHRRPSSGGCAHWSVQLTRLSASGMGDLRWPPNQRLNVCARTRSAPRA
jgi:hypothetical protein